jgi:toxin-antitoxin system PIN domain toxin
LSSQYLLDVNVLVALTHPDHQHFEQATQWFATPNLQWGVCPFSEAGFMRVAVNPQIGSLTIADATAILIDMASLPGYRFWPVEAGWASLAAPFAERIFGHKQIADALLLGLAVREGGILVTFDKAIRSLAGSKLSRHVLVLE